MSGIWLVSYIALWILFLVVAIALLSVMHNLGAVYESLGSQSTKQTPPSKLIVSEPLPEPNLTMIGGSPTPLTTFRRARTAFLVVSPTCTPCRALLKDLTEAKADPDPLDPAVRDWVVVSVGDSHMTEGMVRQIGLPADVPILVDNNGVIARLWGTTTTPTTIIVDENLVVIRQIFGFNTQAAALEPTEQIPVALRIR